eukprot:scaffold119215_cov50-Phaeocystis_antarctica.AAC.5
MPLGLSLGMPPCSRELEPRRRPPKASSSIASSSGSTRLCSRHLRCALMTCSPLTVWSVSALD